MEVVFVVFTGSELSPSVRLWRIKAKTEPDNNQLCVQKRQGGKKGKKSAASASHSSGPTTDTLTEMNRSSNWPLSIILSTRNDK